MQKKIALKRLTASDLTLFEWHFRNRNAGNQKAINLNADVFIRQLYPSLPDIPQANEGKIPLDLYVYGPGLEGEYNLQRKIVKLESYKNWRLDGEYISNPDESPKRFNQLAPGDFVLFEFSGDLYPTSAKAVFLAKAVQADEYLHSVLDRALGKSKMIAVTYLELSELIRSTNPPDIHPVNELILDTAYEDAALGGSLGITKLNSRRSGRGVSHTDLQRYRENATRTGRLGEEYVNAYFLKLQTECSIRNFEWVAYNNAVAPYDFWIQTNNQDYIFVDVKSTLGEFERNIHVSLNELKQMVEVERYDIYRVFNFSEKTAMLRVAENIREFAREILANFSPLPNGVFVDGISVSPSILNFSPPTIIELPDELE